MGLNKEIKLNVLILKYLGIFSILVMILMGIFMVGFSIAINTGFILPANYAENMIKQNKDILMESEPLDKNAIPFTCSYGLFDEKNNFIEGNFKDEDINESLKILNDEDFFDGRYVVIKRENETCIIKYDVNAHFSSQKLNNFIKNPELFLLFLFALLFVFILFIIAVMCGRKIKIQLEPLLNAANNIKNEDLEFKIEYSQIKEFNDVLKSIDDMKEALEKSLKEQWKIEQNKKTYISALAHDIKTPLTIIKGNAEIINEEINNEDIRMFTESIDNNCNKIQEYLTLLIESVKNKDIIKYNFKDMSVKELVSEINRQGYEICSIRNISFETNFEDEGYIVNCDKESIIRGIINVIENAANHSKENSKVIMHIFVKQNRLYIVIDDFGCGFTKEALINAKEQFFTENNERSKKHYGLGMYIANIAAESHGGNLQYINKEREKGARVWMEVPLSRC